jgi:hypothetical protein
MFKSDAGRGRSMRILVGLVFNESHTFLLVQNKQFFRLLYAQLLDLLEGNLQLFVYVVAHQFSIFLASLWV